jgi:hypothetical protein
MGGHSIGGAAAIAAMLADSRIRAGIDMDGTTVAPIPDHGLSRPFLFLGKQANYAPGSGGNVTTWERDWNLLTGWKRWLLVAGAVHASFTDLGLLADQLGIDIGASISGARSLDITRAYVRAFFDQHLRGRPQALLDQASPRYPEVTFCSRGRSDSKSAPPRRRRRFTISGPSCFLARPLRGSGSALVAGVVLLGGQVDDGRQLGCCLRAGVRVPGHQPQRDARPQGEEQDHQRDVVQQPGHRQLLGIGTGSPTIADGGAPVSHAADSVAVGLQTHRAG